MTFDQKEVKEEEVEIRGRGGGGGMEKRRRGGDEVGEKRRWRGEVYLKYRKLNHGSDNAIYIQCNVNG